MLGIAFSLISIWTHFRGAFDAYEWGCAPVLHRFTLVRLITLQAVVSSDCKNACIFCKSGGAQAIPAVSSFPLGMFLARSDCIDTHQDG